MSYCVYCGSKMGEGDRFCVNCGKPVYDGADSSTENKHEDGKQANFMFFENRDFKKNSTRLLNICGDLIDNYQRGRHKPSCKQDLMELIDTRVRAAKDEIAEWKDYDTDYIKIAHTLLAHASFDLLASGEYHIFAGVLNPMSCADNLMDVYKASMEYGVHHGLLDDETREEQYRYLISCIMSVG